ncbi:MAG TPA: hypothetical protein VFV68_10425 [Agriterribacter sp.]|nr:hypothetical protein [Agriterribacter sp.]
MNKLLKPACLLLYLLSVMVFFCTGMWYVAISGMAKNQGLAGGAIVLFNGLIFAVSAFVASIFLAYYATHKTIIIANRILAIILAAFIIVFIYRYSQ